MEDRSTDIIRKIKKLTIVADKKRNFFIIVAIALTSFMMASIFSVGMGYFESINMQEMRMEGSISHMAFNNPTAEQLEILQSLNYVKHVGLAYTIGETNDIPQLNSLILAHVNNIQWEEMFTPTFTNIEGRFAETENEIMLSRHILSAMGISNPEIGMEIPISFSIYGTEEIVKEIFILSGIYTEFSNARPGGFIAIYTSEALAEKYGVAVLENTTVNVIFRDENVGTYIERLKVDLNFGKDQQYTQSPAFNDNYGSVSTYIVLSIVIILLILTGYLLIYNVMHISISRNVRFYGMMKAVGATSGQIRRIVRGQLIYLCLIGLPIGLLFAAGVSMFAVPIVIINSGVKTGVIVSFSPLIYISTIVFTIFTVCLASFVPVRLATSISPTEALKFIGNQSGGKRYRSSVNGKPFKMAWRNIFREQKQAFTVILSLSMGIIVFASIVTIIASWDIERRLLDEHDYDFSITSTTVSSSPYLDRNFIDIVSRLDGIAEIQVRTLESGMLLNSDVLKPYIEYVYAETISSEVGLENQLSQENILSRLLKFGLRGVDSQMLIEFNEDSFSPFDIEAFERGEVALINYSGHDYEVLNSSFAIGSVLDILIGSDQIPHQVVLGGFIEIEPPETGFVFLYSGIEVVVSNNCMQHFFPEPNITSLGLNVKPGYEEQIYNALNSMINQNTTMISRFAARKAMEDSRIIIYALGGGISGILALIGIFNFINVISVGVITRKREFVTLESIGMNKKQMSRILKYEGLGYWFITILISLTMGNLATYILFILFKRVEPSAQFTYPVIPVLIIYLIMLVICVTIPEVIYSSMNKKTLVERMRESE